MYLIDQLKISLEIVQEGNVDYLSGFDQSSVDTIKNSLDVLTLTVAKKEDIFKVVEMYGKEDLHLIALYLFTHELSLEDILLGQSFLSFKIEKAKYASE